MTMDKYMRHMWEHPPACVAGRCRPAPAEVVKVIQGDRGPMVTVFEIDAGQAVRLWATPGHGAYAGPVLIGAGDLHGAAMIFDEYRHGYDGEFGHLGSPPDRLPEPVRCPGCGSPEHHVVVAFQYSGGNEELDDPALIARRQDFFSWFTLRGRCASCGTRFPVVDMECA